ncbi:MAG: hypothetical protein VXZ35_08975 [Pseudomonadota bacterium]|nr:hypothetical protein [Pseudomonadota bacterium]
MKNGAENAKIRETYDAVVATMLSLLRQQSLEVRDGVTPSGTPAAVLQAGAIKLDGRANEAVTRALHDGYAPLDNNIPEKWWREIDGEKGTDSTNNDRDDSDLNAKISDSDDEYDLGG